MINIISDSSLKNARITRSQFYKNFSSDGLMHDTPSGTKFISYKKLNILSQPGLKFEYETKIVNKATNSNFNVHFVNYMFLYKNSLIKIVGYARYGNSFESGVYSEPVKNIQALLKVMIDNMTIN
jgi:hypothetical protein